MFKVNKKRLLHFKNYIIKEHNNYRKCLNVGLPSQQYVFWNNVVNIFRKEIQEINWQRKDMQMQGGEKLRQLEAKWVGLVSKNYEIEQACVQLEKEIAEAERTT